MTFGCQRQDSCSKTRSRHAIQRWCARNLYDFRRLQHPDFESKASSKGLGIEKQH
jgi:hypothetical protein